MGWLERTSLSKCLKTELKKQCIDAFAFLIKDLNIDRSCLVVVAIITMQLNGNVLQFCHLVDFFLIVVGCLRIA